MDLLGDEPPVQAFGVWDAPVTDGAIWLDAVPMGLVCMYCRETIAQGENGAIMPNGFAQHRECSLRGVWGGIGHVVDHSHYCRDVRGPDAGLTYRTSALLVWDVFVHGRVITRDELDEIWEKIGDGDGDD